MDLCRRPVRSNIKMVSKIFQKKNRACRNYGFSLIEVLIALAITSTVIVSVDFSLTAMARLNGKISAAYLILFAEPGS